MQWNELFNKDNQPSENQVKDYIGTPLWDDLDDYLKQTYNVKPKSSYSNCAMDGGMWKGWNIKYQKSGKSLCTVYPKQGYFLLLLQVGLHDMNEAELLMPLCTEYTQTLFNQAQSGHVGKFLAFDIKNESTLSDVKNLVTIRAKRR